MSEEVSVLVVEDENTIRKFITINLLRSGFKVLEAENGEVALEMLRSSNPEVIILDVMLPGMDGFEVCQKIRESEQNPVVIMLTARGQDMDKLMGLELGADDYMLKPFNPLELVARIRAVLRRTVRTLPVEKADTKAKILIDYKAKKVLKNNIELDLAPREYSIVKMFIENPGTALSRDELLNSIWGKNYFGDIKTVDVHIRRIREKIEEDPSEPVFIETVWGFGYRWRKEN